MYPYLIFHYECLSIEKISPFTEARTAHFHPHANTQTSFSTHTLTNHSQNIHTLNKQIHGQKLHSHTHAHAISGITIISFQNQLIRVMILKKLGVKKKQSANQA